jgi:hypothetical protein
VTDDPFTTPNYRPPQRLPRPTEPLFEFVRASDRAPMSCELHFHGESYGWEAMFLEQGTLSHSQRFLLKEWAIRWAESERRAMEGGL